MVENDNSDKAGQESVDDSQKCCSSTSGDNTCCSSASSSYSKRKLVVLVIIVVAAGTILARSLTKESTAVNEDTQQLFATIQLEEKSKTSSPLIAEAKGEVPAAPKSGVENTEAVNKATRKEVPDNAAHSLWRPELDSLASLNTVATNTDVVFVFLAANDQQDNQTITREIESAAEKIQSNGNRICAFRLKKDAPNYAPLAKQFSVPCVLAMVKGGGMSAVSGEINETKLVGAFVTASRPSSGCCPPGAGQSACPPIGPRRR